MENNRTPRFFFFFSEDYYQLDKKKLGEGSYGSVCKATNISTKAIRAVKTISKSQMKNLERFKQEIAPRIDRIPLREGRFVRTAAVTSCGLIDF